jgi:hypothetical protein
MLLEMEYGVLAGNATHEQTGKLSSRLCGHRTSNQQMPLPEPCGKMHFDGASYEEGAAANYHCASRTW